MATRGQIQLDVLLHDITMVAFAMLAGWSLIGLYGTLGGYRAMAIAFNHLVVVHHGSPPAGATPVRPGSKHLFFRGTDITISLLTPSST